MSYIDNLRQETSVTKTFNGAKTYSTSMDAVLDLFAMGGSLRNRDEASIIDLFVRAFSENGDLALKCLFYLRDIRGGQGERRTPKIILKYLAENHPDKIMHLLYLIPEYGRYDDLYIFVDTPLQENALNHLKNAALGINGVDKDPLVFKWLKSLNTSSKESKRLATITRNHFGMQSKQYRQFLSKGRAEVKGLVEHELSNKEVGKIDYSQVPSKANLKYRKAFFRHDEERYTKFIESAKKGEVKINASTLYPSDLVNSIRRTRDNSVEALWNQLPNYVQKEQNALVMADVSGSMTWGSSKGALPIDVSVALAIYFAERNKGFFANHYLTFTSQPNIVKLQGTSLYENVNQVMRTNVGYDTNIQAAFELLLNTAIKNKIPQSELPKTIYVISDMEFNSYGVEGFTNYEGVKQQFEQAGYEIPHLVFWNVNSMHNNVAVSSDTPNTSLVSGYSPILFKQVMENKTPKELMQEVLLAPRYEAISLPK